MSQIALTPHQLNAIHAMQFDPTIGKRVILEPHPTIFGLLQVTHVGPRHPPRTVIIDPIGHLVDLGDLPR